MTKLPYWSEPGLETDEVPLVLSFSRTRARQISSGQEVWDFQIRLQALLGAIAELRRGPQHVRTEHVKNAAETVGAVEAIRDELTLAYAEQSGVSLQQVGEQLALEKSGAQKRIAHARKLHEERAWIGTSPVATPRVQSVRIDVAPGEGLAYGEQTYHLPPGAEMTLDRYGDKVTVRSDRLGRMTVTGWGWVSTDAAAGTVTFHTESGRTYTTRPAPEGVRVT